MLFVKPSVPVKLLLAAFVQFLIYFVCHSCYIVRFLQKDSDSRQLYRSEIVPSALKLATIDTEYSR